MYKESLISQMKNSELRIGKIFVKEIKITFSDKTKVANTEQKIKSFKQEKKNTVDFMIEFDALTMKADTNELYATFLLKKNV